LEKTGYLLDQFLQERANLRDDEYGGSIESRARLMLEVTDACVEVYGAGRVGMHLSPRGHIYTMGDRNLRATFSYVARELGKRKIAFLMTREHVGVDSLNAQLKREFGGVLIANEGFTKASAEAALRRGHADAVGWGRDFVANPDLVRRFEINASLNRPDPTTFYGSGEKGYNDYSLLAGTNTRELQQAL
jgi:2,4-dienoyl-CoA reductase-like NADH-dependent reductase (Old Yellow Enzyme family)